MKKNRTIIFRIFVFCLAVVFVVVTPFVNAFAGENLDYIYKVFIGNKSEYSGIIEIWNIDSFESGIKSKSSFLERVGESFQNQNKGVFVMVRNLTLGECQNLISSGEKPDLISCSYGVAEILKENFSEFNNQNFGIYTNYLNAGKNKSGKQYGIAWCTGFYALISTKSKLEKAGKDVSNVKLNEIALSSSYEYKVGKKTKTSVSLIMGTGDYLMPKIALDAYNKARSIQIENLTKSEMILKSQYSAYSSFLANNATILLGTHRDIIRMAGREEKGKVSDVIYLPLMDFTDLVQFMFCVSSQNSTRKKSAEKFVEMLTSEEIQKQIELIGMFPVRQVEDTSYNGVMRDIILENFSNCELKTLF